MRYVNRLPFWFPFLNRFQTRLAGEATLVQSQNCDLIRSGSFPCLTISPPTNPSPGTSQIQDRAKEIKSISDSHVQRFQREADILQDSLEKLRDVSPPTPHRRITGTNAHQSYRPNALTRRHRVRGISLKDADNKSGSHHLKRHPHFTRFSFKAPECERPYSGHRSLRL